MFGKVLEKVLTPEIRWYFWKFVMKKWESQTYSECKVLFIWENSFEIYIYLSWKLDDIILSRVLTILIYPNNFAT